MGIAKNAVENNQLSNAQDKIVDNLSEKYAKKNYLTPLEQQQLAYLLSKGDEIDRLIRLNQIAPEQLTQAQKQYLAKELNIIAKSYHIPVEDLYNLDFTRIIKRDNSDLKSYLAKENVVNNSFDMKVAHSVKDGAELAAGLGVNSMVVQTGTKLVMSSGLKNVAQKVGYLSEKYPLVFDMGATAAANTGYQLMNNRPYNPYDLLQSELSTVLTRNKSLDKQLSINIMLSTANSDEKDYGISAISAGLGTISAYGSSRYIHPISQYITSEIFGDPEQLKKFMEKNNDEK